MAEIADIQIGAGADCEAVRKAIDISMTIAELPDATILMDIYAGESARYVKARFGDKFDDLANENTASAKAAVIFLTAARLVYAVKQVTSEQLFGGAMSWKPTDYDAKYAELEGRVDQIISTTLENLSGGDSDLSNLNPNIFTVASARRRTRF